VFQTIESTRLRLTATEAPFGASMATQRHRAA
jgi:hypothetical protein